MYMEEFKLPTEQKNNLSDKLKHLIETNEQELNEIKENENLLIDIIENRFLYLEN